MYGSITEVMIMKSQVLNIIISTLLILGIIYILTNFFFPPIQITISESSKEIKKINYYFIEYSSNNFIAWYLFSQRVTFCVPN